MARHRGSLRGPRARWRRPLPCGADYDVRPAVISDRQRTPVETHCSSCSGGACHRSWLGSLTWSPPAVLLLVSPPRSRRSSPWCWLSCSARWWQPSPRRPWTRPRRWCSARCTAVAATPARRSPTTSSSCSTPATAGRGRRVVGAVRLGGRRPWQVTPLTGVGAGRRVLPGPGGRRGGLARTAAHPGRRRDDRHGSGEAARLRSCAQRHRLGMRGGLLYARTAWSTSSATAPPTTPRAASRPRH